MNEELAHMILEYCCEHAGSSITFLMEDSWWKKMHTEEVKCDTFIKFQTQYLFSSAILSPWVLFETTLNNVILLLIPYKFWDTSQKTTESLSHRNTCCRTNIPFCIADWKGSSGVDTFFPEEESLGKEEQPHQRRMLGWQKENNTKKECRSLGDVSLLE